MSIADITSSAMSDSRPPERTPPQDVAAEQSVLGALLLSKDAIADVVETVREADFYRPAHQTIYAAILELYGRNEAVDAVTVADFLAKQGSLVRVGGAPYLYSLTASVPVAANGGYYAKIVTEQAVLRRLVEAGTRITQMGYAAEGEVDQLVDRAQAEVYDVTGNRVAEDYQPLENLMQGAIEEIEAIDSRGGQLVGVPTGFTDLDRLTNGLHGGQMIIVAARPAMGKSTVGLDFARSASITHGLTSAIFSLEMARNEIIMRLLSAEARVPLQHLRNGGLQDADWMRLAQTQSELSSAPLFIDDSPNLTLMEIRAKCRRLKQRHDLRLVVVDYLQLMTSGRKVESRQQEVSDFSRSLKLLAKELEVPVVAISQLNRGPEQRTDKRPMISDLRESGCLTADTRVVRADTGAEVTLGELHATGARDVPVWALDDSLRYVKSTMTHVFPTGHRQTFALQLASGRRLKATANHRFLTLDGWRHLSDLQPGSRIGAPRHVPPPADISPGNEDEIVLLAHLLGDGSVIARQPVRYASVDEANLTAVAAAADRRFGITAIRDDISKYPDSRVTTLRLPAPFRLTHGKRNPIASWFDDQGLFNRRSHEKFIPSWVSALPKEQIALFLRHLWATDGTIILAKSGKGGAVRYNTTSRQLADGVAHLLLRFGINARIRCVPQVKSGRTYRDNYFVEVSGSADQKVFLRRISVHGARGEAAARLLARIENVKANTNVDNVPKQVWGTVREVLKEKAITTREFQSSLGMSYCGSTLYKSAPRRERLGRVASILDSAELELLATNDLIWDEIVSIEPLGSEDVFDATVLSRHNFIANGIAAHNSLEQDADLVMLLHREDAYDREARPGEADFIVAKHRNGPTKTITVAFQGHYSRFVDMAHE